jgi:hypothetical protein
MPGLLEYGAAFVGLEPDKTSPLLLVPLQILSISDARPELD